MQVAVDRNQKLKTDNSDYPGIEQFPFIHRFLTDLQDVVIKHSIVADIWMGIMKTERGSKRETIGKVIKSSHQAKSSHPTIKSMPENAMRTERGKMGKMESDRMKQMWTRPLHQSVLP